MPPVTQHLVQRHSGEMMVKRLIAGQSVVTLSGPTATDEGPMDLIQFDRIRQFGSAAWHPLWRAASWRRKAA